MSDELESVLVAYPKGLLDPIEVRRALSQLLMSKAKGAPSWLGKDELIFPATQDDHLIECLSRHRRFEVNLLNDWPKNQAELADRFERWGKLHQKARRAAKLEGM